MGNPTDKKGDFFSVFEPMTGSSVIPFSCGRAAALAGLKALGFGRMDEIFVPPFMCQAVLAALTHTSLPALAPSRRTRGIFVFHQFGYPQRLDVIEKEAASYGWKVVSDCAHTLFSSYQNKNVLGWGDFSIISFSKVYPCILGGALVSSRDDLVSMVKAYCENSSGEQIKYVRSAYKVLQKANNGLCVGDQALEIAAVYGYLPKITVFPPDSLQAMPSSTEEIKEETKRREHVAHIVCDYFPDNTPECPESYVIPWAVPVLIDPLRLNYVVEEIKKDTGVDVPVLHFDVARNMLHPDYRKCIVVECGNRHDENTVIDICEAIRKGGVN